MADQIVTWGALVFKLGLAVYEAVKSGDTTKTVGEIFDGVGRDLDEVKRLEAEAAAKFGAGGA